MVEVAGDSAHDQVLAQGLAQDRQRVPRRLEIGEVADVHVAVEEIDRMFAQQESVAVALQVAGIAKGRGHAGPIERFDQARHLGDAVGPVAVFEDADARVGAKAQGAAVACQKSHDACAGRGVRVQGNADALAEYHVL